MDHKDKLQTLMRVNDEMQGSIIVSLLADAGIQATCTGVFTAGFRAEAPGYVDVVVNEADLPKAKEIIASIEVQGQIDWSAVDVGEPEE